MKGIVTTFLLLIGITSFSQDPSCGQVPRADVEIKAELNFDLDAAIERDFGKQFKNAGVDGLFKLFVDCKGEVYKCVYQNGTLLSAEADKFMELIQSSKWNPAFIGQESVNSIVFVKIDLQKGSASHTIQ